MKIVKAMSLLFVVGLCLAGFSHKAYAASSDMVKLTVVNNYSVVVDSAVLQALGGGEQGIYLSKSELQPGQSYSEKFSVNPSSPPFQFTGLFLTSSGIVNCPTKTFSKPPHFVYGRLGSTGKTCTISN